MEDNRDISKIYSFSESKIDKYYKNKFGVYFITNLLERTIYIGSSSNLYERFKDHRRNLKNHPNRNIRNLKNKECLYFEIVSLSENLEESIKTEQHYLDIFFGNKNKLICLNINPKAGSCLGRKCTPEQIEKMKNRVLPKFSEERRIEYKEIFSGEGNPMYGKHHSEETKIKISKANKGKKLTQERIDIMKIKFSGEGNPNYGKKCKQETKDKISKANKGRKMSNEFREKCRNNSSGVNNPNAKLTEEQIKDIIIRDRNGEFYKDLAAEFNICPHTIYKLRKKYKDEF